MTGRRSEELANLLAVGPSYRPTICLMGLQSKLIRQCEWTASRT